MKTESASNVARFAFFEFLAGCAPQLVVVDTILREHRALQPPHLAQRRCNAVLPQIVGQLAHDERRRHGASADGYDDAENGRPAGPDRGISMLGCEFTREFAPCVNAAYYTGLGPTVAFARREVSSIKDVRFCTWHPDLVVSICTERRRSLSPE